jgi:hypothetical protein
MTKKQIGKAIIAYTILCFGIIIFLLWADEIFDVPHTVFGARATPINWTESTFESVLVFLLCSLVIVVSRNLLTRIKYLEGFLPVCSACKRIKVDHEWVPFDKYLSNHLEAEITRSLCPECADKQGHDFMVYGKWVDEET